MYAGAGAAGAARGPLQRGQGTGHERAARCAGCRAAGPRLVAVSSRARRAPRWVRSRGGRTCQSARETEARGQRIAEDGASGAADGGHGGHGGHGGGGGGGHVSTQKFAILLETGPRLS